MDPRTVRLFDHERLVPSALLPPDDPTETRPRTVRDWVVDVLLVSGAGGLGVIALLGAGDAAVDGPSASAERIDVVVGAIALAALGVRRRAPIVVGLVTAVGAAVSAVAAVAAIVGLFTVAVHRRASAIVPVVVANLVASHVYVVLRPQHEMWITSQLVSLAVFAVVTASGMAVRARRQLVWTLEERASRAEAEQELLAERARAAERDRIAREMHDVLGHRISLMALHAGGLELRPDLPAEEVAATAGLLRTTARQALEELRAVIGILRDDGTVGAPSAPQPTLSDLRRLVDDSRAAGATVSLTLDAEGAESAPTNGRIAYRVVQEALTNVAKHARGAAVVVTVVGRPDDGLSVEVRNSVPPRAGGDVLPGSGVGLIGLRERVELAGGTLTHGFDRRGDFVVEARLRWA